MTQEEKAKAYDNVRDKIAIRFGSNVAKEIFSEYEESEDELTWLKRFIKEEIDYLFFDIRDSEDRVKLKNLQRSLAWLEKQGNLMKALQISNARIGELIEENYYLKEQLEKQCKNNMGISEATKQKLEDNLNKALQKETPESWNKFLDEQSEQNPTDKVEPKFKYGDRVRNKKSGLEQTLGSCIEDVYEGAYPFRIKDQDDWELVEQESTWSDEDNKMYNNLTEFEKAVKQVMEEAIECGDTHNLKADADMLLRLVQKSSWSEEDENILDAITYTVKNSGYKHCIGVSNEMMITFIESLKQRYTWKPSGEQMLAINTAINVLGKGTINGKYLIELQEQLKKLREEDV